METVLPCPVEGLVPPHRFSHTRDRRLDQRIELLTDPLFPARRRRDVPGDGLWAVTLGDLGVAAREQLRSVSALHLLSHRRAPSSVVAARTPA